MIVSSLFEQLSLMRLFCYCDVESTLRSETVGEPEKQNPSALFSNKQKMKPTLAESNTYFTSYFRGIPHTLAVTHTRAHTHFLLSNCGVTEDDDAQPRHVHPRLPPPPPPPSSLRKEQIDAFETAIMRPSSTAVYNLTANHLHCVF
ncbi:unnamed protein product [Leuciscus chuanchicus]